MRPFTSARRVFSVMVLLAAVWSVGAALAAGSAAAQAMDTGSPLGSPLDSPLGSPLRPVPQADRVAAHANLGPQVQLQNHLPRWVRPENLAQRTVDLQQTVHLTLVLRRAPAVQAAFEQLLVAQQDPASPLYHHWLTPQQVGALYGPTAADTAAVTAWAASQGLHLDSAAPSGVLLEFSGPLVAASVAFRTSFSYYLLNGKPHLSADIGPSIPAALEPVVAVVNGLSEIDIEPQEHHAQGRAQPAYTNGSGNHYLTPNDFTTIFDLAGVYASGNTGQTVGGKAQHIAIIDESDLVTQDIADYASRVGISGYTLKTIFAAGIDPGLGSSQGESTLDVMRTIGTAPGAAADLVVAAAVNGGIYTAASYNVNTLVDPVMTISWGSCEASGGLTLDTKWDTLFSAAAAEGISTFVSSGDSGAAGCDSHGDVLPPAVQSLSINGFCASSYATCVGGTEFADFATPTLFWSTANGTGLSSAISYIPEGAWNSPTDANGNADVEATTGGVSLYMLKPAWQTGTGVPADGHRDVPDISFPAASHDGYYGCLNLNCENGMFEYFGGTSAAAPGMAGVAALLNTRAGSAQGNWNPMLYRLAAGSAANKAFHDTTVVSSGVASCSVATPSMCNNSMPSPTGLAGGLAGYLLTAGYDQVTGWGSLDVGNFLASAAPVATSLAVKASATQALTTTPLTFTATLTPSATSVAAPSGTVQFYANGAAFGSPLTLTGSTVASAAQTFAPAGNYSITAVYSGDSYFAGSTSTGVAVVTTVPLFSLSTAASSISFVSGATTGNTDALTVTSLGSFAGTVSLACSLSGGTAAYPPTCSVSPASVTLAAGGSAASVVSIGSTTATSSLQPPAGLAPMRGFGLGGGISVAALLWLLPRRRRWKTMPLTLLAACGLLSLAGMAGCGKSTSPAPVVKSSAGTYTVTVTASSAAYSTTAAFNVTIQ